MLKAAFYETEVTAPLGSYLPGSYRSVYATDVRDRLYAKAVVIDNGSETIGIVALDTVKLPGETHDMIAERVREYTGIKPENITVAFNHTHTGAPMTKNPEIGEYGDPAYVSVTTRLMADCITLAYRRLQNTVIKYGCGEVHGVSFNRDYVLKDGTIVMNAGHNDSPVTEYQVAPEVPVVKFKEAHPYSDKDILNPNCAGNLAGIDPELPVLFFEDEQGTPIGAVINFACHQTCMSDTEFSGDYSSILSKELKKKYGSDFVCVFLNGTSGDINHIDPTIPSGPRREVCVQFGQKLAAEAIRVYESASEEITGDILLSRKEKIRIPKRMVDDAAVEKEILKYQRSASKSLMTLRNLIYYQAVNKEEFAEAYIQCIRIGDVYLFALPGDIYVNFGLHLKKHSPSAKTMVSEYANGPYFGYVPTKEAFLPQSMLYEPSLCMNSCLIPEGGYMMVEKALELADELKDY